MKKYIFMVTVIFIGGLLTFKFINLNNEYKVGNCGSKTTKQYLKEKEKEYDELIYDENSYKRDSYDGLFLKKVHKDLTFDGKYDLYIFQRGIKNKIISYEDLIKYDFKGSLIDIYSGDSKAGQTEFLFIQEKNNDKIIFSLKLHEIYLSKKIIHTFSAGAASIVIQLKCIIKN